LIHRMGHLRTIRVTGCVVGKLVKAIALGRMARLGPVGMAVAAYGVWHELTPEHQALVRERAASLVRRIRSRSFDPILGPQASR
jgi:hypothetical protein